MTLYQFLNGIRILWNIDADEFLSCINQEDREFFGDRALWKRFRDDPHKTFAGLPEQDQERIFAMIERRNTAAGIGADRAEGVTGRGECAVGDATGETGGHVGELPVNDPAALTLGFDYRCDCCDNGLQAEWDFCPWCGKIQREEPSGLCLAGLATNTACRPDDTLKCCTICGFVIDTKYAAEAPAKERGPRK